MPSSSRPQSRREAMSVTPLKRVLFEGQVTEPPIRVGMPGRWRRAPCRMQHVWQSCRQAAQTGSAASQPSGQLAVEHLHLERRAQLRIHRLVAGDQRVPGGLLLRAARPPAGSVYHHSAPRTAHLRGGRAPAWSAALPLRRAARRGLRGVLLVGAAVRVQLANDEAGPVGDLLLCAAVGSAMAGMSCALTVCTCQP